MSDCLGDARNTTPSRSWSYRAAAMCIISTAQHAKPNVIGHIEPCRAQLTILSIVDKTYSALFLGVSRLNWLLPCCARVVIGIPSGVDGDESFVLIDAVGVEGFIKVEVDEIERRDASGANRSTGQPEQSALEIRINSPIAIALRCAIDIRAPRKPGNIMLAIFRVIERERFDACKYERSIRSRLRV